MAVDRAELQRRAISKAQRVGGPARVVRLDHGIYRVPSATEPDAYYIVTGTKFDASDHLCTCPAGEMGKPCWHIAAVRLRRIQEAWLAWARKRQRRQEEAPRWCPFLPVAASDAHVALAA